MQLISLNIWGGHVREPLARFIKTYQDVDVFCLQEVYREADHKIALDDRVVNLHVYEEIEKLLPNHQGFFRPVVDGIFGQAIFIKKIFFTIIHLSINSDK